VPSAVRSIAAGGTFEIKPSLLLCVALTKIRERIAVLTRGTPLLGDGKSGGKFVYLMPRVENPLLITKTIVLIGVFVIKPVIFCLYWRQ
jgi:hypothetical protein